jgi:DNA-binding response OmpR family regulator
LIQGMGVAIFAKGVGRHAPGYAGETSDERPMPAARKILICDPDAATLRQLGPALRARGYVVHSARDGSKALEVAILRFPDLVLFDERTTLIDARTFVKILRTNPRTEQIPVIVTGDSLDLDRGRMGAFLKKPFNQDEVLSRIDQILRKIEAARAVSGDNKDIEGNLAQIPLVDLLQILAVNRKTGRLSLDRQDSPEASGELVLKEGRVVDARAGAATGEKALYRLLVYREGQFAFIPGKGSGPERIDRKLDELILEGMRQADEIGRLVPSLPSRADLIELSGDGGEIPAGLHPVTEEVVRILDHPRSLAEVLDRSVATDLEAMRAVTALIERGFARRREGEAPEAEKIGPLLAPPELHALRARIAKGRASGSLAVGKVILTGGGPLARRNARARLAALPGFVSERDAAVGFGTIGRLALSEGVRIDVCEMPGESYQRPLWRPFVAGALGAIILLPAEGSEPLVIEIGKSFRIPMVICGPSREHLGKDLGDIGDLGAAVAFGGTDAAEALRALLGGAGVRTTAY